MNWKPWKAPREELGKTRICCLCAHHVRISLFTRGGIKRSSWICQFCYTQWLANQCHLKHAKAARKGGDRVVPRVTGKQMIKYVVLANDDHTELALTTLKAWLKDKKSKVFLDVDTGLPLKMVRGFEAKNWDAAKVKYNELLVAVRGERDPVKRLSQKELVEISDALDRDFRPLEKQDITDKLIDKLSKQLFNKSFSQVYRSVTRRRTKGKKK